MNLLDAWNHPLPCQTQDHVFHLDPLDLHLAEYRQATYEINSGRQLSQVYFSYTYKKCEITYASHLFIHSEIALNKTK